LYSKVVQEAGGQGYVDVGCLQALPNGLDALELRTKGDICRDFALTTIDFAAFVLDSITMYWSEGGQTISLLVTPFKRVQHRYQPGFSSGRP